MTTMAPALSRTPLHHWHATHGARLVERVGWQVPAGYIHHAAEGGIARNGLGMADISAMTKISLRGRGIDSVTSALLGGAAVKPRGVAALDARMLAFACRLSEEHLLLLAGVMSAAAFRDRLGVSLEIPELVAHDVTSAYAGFYLVGPRLEELLRRVTALDVRPASFPFASCVETGLAGVPAVLLRPPHQSVPQMHVYVAWDVAEYVWERLLHAGRDLGLLPEGLEVLAIVAMAGAS